jgi:hypothetical protein
MTRRFSSGVLGSCIVAWGASLSAGAVDAQQPDSIRIVVQVRDASDGTPVAGADLVPDRGTSLFRTDRTGDLALRLRRGTPAAYTVRRIGFVAQSLLIDGEEDTVRVDLGRMVPVLAPVIIEESLEKSLPPDIYEDLRRRDHTRLHGPREFAASGEKLVGAFLLGRGGVVTVPCPPPPGATPAGTRRTQPVDRDPSALFWPCAPSRDKTRPVIVIIDNGPMQPFDRVRSMNLDQVGAIAVTQGAMLRIYTKAYLEARRAQVRFDSGK